MLWNNAVFVAAFEARARAEQLKHVQRSTRTLQVIERHAAAKRQLDPPRSALHAMQLIAASLGEHADAELAAFDQERTALGLTADEDDLVRLRIRIRDELLLRRVRVEEMVAATLGPLGLTRALARTLVDQSYQRAEARVAAHTLNPPAVRRRTVFIGHSAIDDRLAFLLKGSIAAFVPADVEVFVSSDLDSIKAGEDWLERIVDQLRNCSVVVAIITPNSTRSSWVHYEVGLADAGHPLVIPVTARGGRLSQLPAPLGRRHGRNLAIADEALVLLTEVAAEMGVSDREEGPQDFDEMVREAKRPILGAGLSETAMRISERLSARSKNATEWDPSVDAETLMKELDVTAVSFLAAIAELQELGWLVTREGIGTLGVSMLGPAEKFFIDSQSALGPADPAHDARTIAVLVARRPREAARVTSLAAELGWGPRRMNAALHVLHAAAPDAVLRRESGGPHAYVLVIPEPAVLRLAQPR